MASPQAEKGHVRIAFDLYDKIIEYPFTNTEQKAVWAVIRHTYGWSRTKAKATYYLISKMTNMDRTNTRRAVNKLHKDHIVFIQTCRDGSFIIGLNKNYDEWKHNRKDDQLWP